MGWAISVIILALEPRHLRVIVTRQLICETSFCENASKRDQYRLLAISEQEA